MKSSVSRPERMRSALTRVGADAVRAVIDRVLAHQEQRRGLGQAVGPEIRARIDRLLGDVEQQAAAGALRQHDLHGGLRDALMAEEIQLEALAQRSLRRPRRCGPARPRRRSRRRCRRRRTPATTCVERRARPMRRSVTSHGTGKRRRRRWPRRPSGRRRSRHRAARPRRRRRQTPCAVAAPIAPPAPVIDRDLAGQRQLGFAWPSLACSMRPVFDVEHVGLGDRLEAADRLGVGDGGRSRPRRDRRRCGRPSPSGRARRGRAPAPARCGAADRPFSCRRRSARCGARNIACSCRCRPRRRRGPRA